MQRRDVANRVACVIIASESRKGLVFDRVLPSVLTQGFDEVVLVGDWSEAIKYERFRYVRVGPVQRNTLDALLKRDAGVLATTSPTIIFLCDDHALGPDFLAELREVLDEPWDVLVPNRCTRLPGTDEHVALNMGEHEGYCGGHGGVYRREFVQALPWMSFAHGEPAYTRLWDVSHSRELQLPRWGARFVWRPRAGIAIEDLEPERKPWL